MFDIFGKLLNYKSYFWLFDRNLQKTFVPNKYSSQEKNPCNALLITTEKLFKIGKYIYDLFKSKSLEILFIIL